MLVSLVQCLTITGKGERLSEVLTDDSDLHADPQTLMQLLLTHRRRPHEASVLRAVAVRVRRTQPDQTKHKTLSGVLQRGTEVCISCDVRGHFSLVTETLNDFSLNWLYIINWNIKVRKISQQELIKLFDWLMMWSDWFQTLRTGRALNYPEVHQCLHADQVISSESTQCAVKGLINQNQLCWQQ